MLIGYLLRIADCTNVDEKTVVMRLRRLVLEMIYHGHKKKIVQSVIKEVGEQLLCETRQIEECLEWTTEQQEVFRLCHDAAYRLEEML